MEKIWLALADFHTLITVTGVVALFVAIVAPIQIGRLGFSLNLAAWQRWALGGLGVFAIIGAIAISMYRGKGELPIGSVIAWVPIGELTYPPEWVLCGNGNKTPTLANKFLMGASSVNEAGKPGGIEKLPPDGAHKSKVTTAPSSRTQERKLPCDDGRCGLNQQHIHDIEISIPNHDHGGNILPPYYTVVFLCKVR